MFSTSLYDDIRTKEASQKRICDLKRHRERGGLDNVVVCVCVCVCVCVRVRVRACVYIYMGGKCCTYLLS